MYKILSQETKKQEVSRNKMCGDTKKMKQNMYIS